MVKTQTGEKMRPVLFALLVLLIALPVMARDWSRVPFDAARLSVDERRVMQSAMILAGVYAGPVDGIWGKDSQKALTRFTTQAFGSAKPTFGQIAPLVSAFELERRDSGWRMVYYQSPDRSFALPSGLLADLSGPDALTWEAEDGSLSVNFDYAGAEQTLAAHKLLQLRRDPAAEPFHRATAGQITTSVTLKNGGSGYLRSDRAGDGFVTLLLSAGPAQLFRMALIALTYGPGEAPDLEMPRGGILATLAEQPPNVVEEPRAKLADLNPKDASSTGSGFYISASHMVTAAHVAKGCKAISLADGSPVATRRLDADLDLAVLEPELKSATWLNLSPNAEPRLGETVYALGYPYLGLLNQGLSVTGGNVSAMGGIDPSEVRIMVSAPVQPGNSGGPLITANGDVVGVVVSRIDDMNIFDQTGTLPQNMNFAVPPKALVAFLAKAGVEPVPSPQVEIDIGRGLPDTMRDAVVPLFCY